MLSITIRNRREAYDEIKPKRESRKVMILEVLENGDPNGMTAEEVAQQLLHDGKITHIDPNFTRPRLTELKEEGKVEVVGKRRSLITARNTAVWKVVKH
ncbi:DNA gyrase [Clostridiaceae bacterium]|jgi:hypothetical protein|nr:DNA gyrase [Clostridiaceae bacterium]